MGLADTKPHALPHPHTFLNANSVTWTSYAKIEPDWSINEFLAGIMMSMGVAITTPHPLMANVSSNAHLVAWKSHSKFRSGWLFD